MERKKYTTEVGGKTLTLEISSMAEQANAAVLAKYGETVVLVTAVMGEKDGLADYMPLRVDYEERFYAAGKIGGSRFIRRESRPSEDAILSGRLIDRTIRPLFDHRIRRDIQVVATVLAIDEANEPDFTALVGASTALSISSIPWAGPAAGVKIAKINGALVVNPAKADLEKPECAFELFAAGPEGRISMIECGAKEVSNEDILAAAKIAQNEIDKLVAFQKSIAKEIGKQKKQVLLFEIGADLRAAGEAFLAEHLEGSLYKVNKLEYVEAMRDLKNNYLAHLKEKFADALDGRAAEALWEEIVNDVVHKNILEKEKRPDSRKVDEIRQLSGEVGLFERTHGSALFVRGNTQALAVTTLAAPGAEQLIETMEATGKKRFLLHYNFPPYSVGETGPFRGPGRREIGHGALAEKALKSLIPSQEEFPYTIRVVSETLSSNGSSSMATVSASSLSMMDAGVPLKKPAAGIAMGIMTDEQKGRKENPTFKVLTDIQGPEDHYGDMDFKVAGTDTGVTAIQLDVKIYGLTLPMIEQTLKQAKDARLAILNVTNGVLPAPREKLSKYAPAVFRLQINPDKIGMVIGPGGKMINGLIKKHELGGIDIDEDGSVFVSGTDHDRARQALEEIRSMTKEFKVGEMVEGKIVKILEFGAIVDIGGGRDGMIHVSELKEGFVKKVEDVVKLGDFVRPKVIRVEDDGRIGLSLKKAQ